MSQYPQPWCRHSQTSPISSTSTTIPHALTVHMVPPIRTKASNPSGSPVVSGPKLCGTTGHTSAVAHTCKPHTSSNSLCSSYRSIACYSYLSPLCNLWECTPTTPAMTWATWRDTGSILRRSITFSVSSAPQSYGAMLGIFPGGSGAGSMVLLPCSHGTCQPSS
jgi:hypothetical protein